MKHRILICQGECWFNKFLPGGSKHSVHLDLPVFLFLWKRLISTSYGFTHGRNLAHMLNTTGQPACCSPIYVNIVDQSTSKHRDGVQTQPLLFNKELEWNLRWYMCTATVVCKMYQNNMTRATFLNHKGKSRFGRLSLTAVLRNHAIRSSDYKRNTACTSHIPQVRLVFLYLRSRLENSRNPWLQYATGRQASWSKLFTGTTGIQAM